MYHRLEKATMGGSLLVEMDTLRRSFDSVSFDNNDFGF